MYNGKFENQLLAFRNLRKEIDQNQDPILFAANYWLSLPFVKYTMDPWDTSTWPANPWELIQEKELCRFGRILGLCYTLQLTETFSSEDFEIIIGVDKENTDYHYIVSVNGLYIGLYDNTKPIKILPEGFVINTVHQMPKLQ